MEPNYMFDNFVKKGTDINELKHICKVLDDNSKIVKLDLADCSIGHFFALDDKALQILVLVPGEVFKPANFIGKNGGKKKTITVGNIQQWDLSIFTSTGMLPLAEEMKNSEKKNGTVFFTENPETGKPDIIFTSQTLLRTFSTRLHCPAGSSLERDIFLSCLISNSEMKNVSDFAKEDVLPIYATTRIFDSNKGKFVKIFSFYENEPEKRSFTKMVEEAESAGNGAKCIRWRVTQEGVEAWFTYENELNTFKSMYPEFGYIPVNVFKASDTSCKNCVESAFMINENLDFVDKAFPVKLGESYKNAIAGSMLTHEQHASQFCRDKDILVQVDEERFITTVSEIAKNAEMNKAGKGVMKSFSAFAKNHRIPNPTVGDINKFFIDAYKESIKDGITSYSQKVMREHVEGKIALLQADEINKIAKK